jgi:hypothetical protein
VVNLGVVGPITPTNNQVFGLLGVTRISSPSLQMPIDLAPTQRNTDDVSWASNTTLDEVSDIYVANRGNNTIVRMRQEGSVVAVRGVAFEGPLANGQLNGIATSPDGKTIYVTFTGPQPGQGGVLALPAFDTPVVN